MRLVSLNIASGRDREGAYDLARVAGRPGLHAGFAAALDGTPGPGGASRPARSTAQGTPAYGVALLSRLPVLATHELRMAPARGRIPIALPPGTRPPVWFMPDEQRVALAAVLAGPGGPWDRHQHAPVVRAAEGRASAPRDPAGRGPSSTMSSPMGRYAAAVPPAWSRRVAVTTSASSPR